MVDCGPPLAPTGFTAEPFSNTTFGSMVTFRYEETARAVCTGKGEWKFNQTSLKCRNTSSG